MNMYILFLEKLMQCFGANPTKREVEELIRKHDRVNEKTGKRTNIKLLWECPYFAF